MTKILITGCCGFIGSHLVDFFIKKNYYTIGVDNLLTGNLKNIEHLNSNSNFKFIQADICDDFKINEKLDYILHFASPASPKDYLKYPIKTLKTGAIGTQNVLDLALKHNSTILVASSSEIYGDPLEHPQSESYFGNVNSIGPRSVYDEAKRYLEAITMAYHNKYKLNTKIARIFNTYGPRMRVNDGRAIPNFINQAINNENFTIYGNGYQTRSFCYVSDTIKCIHRYLNSNYNYPINIGNPTEKSIIELTNIIKHITNSKSQCKYLDDLIDDPKLRRPDISLAKKILNWRPETNLEDGLKITIDYYKKLYIEE